MSYNVHLFHIIVQGFHTVITLKTMCFLHHSMWCPHLSLDHAGNPHIHAIPQVVTNCKCANLEEHGGLQSFSFSEFWQTGSTVSPHCKTHDKIN